MKHLQAAWKILSEWGLLFIILYLVSFLHIKIIANVNIYTTTGISRDANAKW